MVDAQYGVREKRVVRFEIEPKMFHFGKNHSHILQAWPDPLGREKRQQPTQTN